MRKPAKDKEQILRELTEVFRANGYDGTTLSKLTEKTGLERASLYHYFPGGKKEMASAVLAYVLEELSGTVLKVLQSDQPAEQRLIAMLDATTRFYNGGEDLCFVSIFAIGENSEEVSTTLREAVGGWLTSMEKALAEAGKSKPGSLANASLSCIQGGLVLAGVNRDPKLFLDAIEFVRIGWALTDDQ